ncbi:MAG TPA: DNA replication and repair protein RecF [Thermoleophilaceae bacterium]|nr:DNA replication and repair protein RecF [Thermoleophilaceae bacterium]
MRVARVELRDFRNYARAAVELPDGLTVICGANGAGKTNLLEAVYFGCTGRSPRTANEREVVRRGAAVARVALDLAEGEGSHRLEVGFEPGEAKRVLLDGRALDGPPGLDARPPVSVFLPERLELVKGAPAARRAHLDHLVAALWPARAGTRAAYSRALAQRNALLGRVRASGSAGHGLGAWDAEVARQGLQLMEDRREAVDGLRPGFAALAERLGLPGEAELRYRPRSPATSVEELAAELAERRAADLERGFTAHGPHRDEIQLLLGGTALRAYGSQGQQRVALLALLFAERELIAARRGPAPLMLLDDVMSELDADRRDLLAELLRSGGQSVVTTTERAHVPGSDGAVVAVDGGRILGAAGALAA